MENVIKLFSNSGFTALLSMVLRLLIKGLLDARLEKKKEQERFFYEIYSRRIELYRKILKQIHLFFDQTFSDPLSNPKKIGDITAAFFEFSETGMLVASHTVTTTLQEISYFISDQIVKISGERNIKKAEMFLLRIREFLTVLKEQIRTETCPVLVDNYLFKLTGAKTTHKTSKENKI